MWFCIKWQRLVVAGPVLRHSLWEPEAHWHDLCFHFRRIPIFARTATNHTIVLTNVGKWYEMHSSNIMTMVSSKLYTNYSITTTKWENLKVKCTNASCNPLSTTLLDWDDSTEVEVLKWATSILWYMFNVIRNMHAVCPHIDLWGSIKFRIGHSRSNQQENKAATMSLSYHANNNTKANGWGAWTRSWIRLDQA